MKVYRDIVDANGNVTATQEIFDIMEWTYSGTDMGERSITTTVKYATPIDFQAGDYVEFNIADLIRQTNVEGGSFYERFYLYTMPTIKKTASPFSAGDAFEHTVTFYPRQYELGCTQMRDLVQDDGSGILYTGWDEFSFYGGAKMLMDRIIAVLHERYGTKGVEGVDYWGYKIADSINEERNTALEKFQFDFSGNNVMDAILKLNESEGINTKFFINSRMIYVGYKRPYIVGVDDANILKTVPFDFQYGKTSHLPKNINYGNLFTITKSIGNSSPITRLYTYGADRNLHRFYCSDRIKSGRYVNHLMLPSFANDGKTDYIESAEGIAKFGIREGSKTFDNIYPSLRYFTYGDLREIKYVIKLMGCGLESDENGVYTSEDLKKYTRPLARVQCYKVVEGSNGANSLQESYPPVNLAIFLHATGKVVKCTLYTSAAAQKQHDSIIPTRTDGKIIAGACFAVHDAGYDCAHEHTTTRDEWFSNPDTIEDEAKKNEIEIHQINYTDTHWITDIFEFESYNQTTFPRHGYSAYCYPRINKNYPNSKADSIDVNSIIDVGKVLIEDTDLNVSEKKNQATFEIYLRDIGFQINEQTWFGDKVFVFDTPKVNFLDGNLGGYSFEIPNESEQKEFAEVIVPAILPNGTRNAAFFDNAQDPSQAEQAYQNGAYWRILLKRCDTEINNYWLPNTMLNASAGDRIVLLDIFMPDVYIRVAENRLLREAQKYLDANDDGDIQYTFDIDKVRLLQIPAFGLQMREGAIMRIVDNDLDIKTSNSIRLIRDNAIPVVSTKSLLVSEITGVEEIPDNVEYYIEHRDFDYLVGKGVFGEDGETYPNVRFNTLRGWTATFDMQIAADDVDGVIQFRNNMIIITNVKHIWDATAKKWVWEKGLSCGAHVTKIQDSSTDNRIKKVTFDIVGNVFNLRASETVDSHGNKIYPCSFYYEYDVLMQRTIPGYNKYQFGLFPLPSGTNVFCEAIDLIDFQANKYYEVTIDVDNTTLPAFDTNGKRTLFALVNGLGAGQQYFTPEYTATEVDKTQHPFVGMKNYNRYVFKFTLGEDFNDNTPYYPAIRYISDGNTEKVSVRLVSIVEKDSDSVSDLNYVDLGIDTISIRCNENTRVSPATTQMREITATVKEETRASAWVQVMQRIESNEILGEQTIRTQETVANMARRHYRELLALKNSIFDPDGTCDQTFLQVMMMQVGADSMNYQLDRTRTGLNSQGAEVRFNCAINGNTFTIDQDDTLRHYVYTEGAQGGTWRIKGNKTFALDGQNTYFVALRCEIEGDNGEWICSTEQHKVNEDEGYWYFNWAILNLVSGGYVLTETRGNAYMYGDNLVCGKISTLAGNSYFDLTKGNFVLSNGEKPALSYINGVLTISGVATDKDAEDILAKLGIVENTANTASSTAQTALDAANNISVGGRNYIKNSATTSITAIGETYTKQERLYFYLTIDDWNNLRGKYVSISCDVDIQNAVAGTDYDWHRALFQLAFRHTDGSITYTSSANLQIKFGNSDNPVTVKGRYDDVIKVPDKEIEEVIQDYLYVQGLGSGSVSMSHPKLEFGNKATDWTPAPEDIQADLDAVNADIEQTRKDLTSTNKNVSAITDDNIISGGTEKSELKREWQIIAGENMLGTADGSYYKAKTQASTYNVAFTNMTAAFDKLRYAMASILANPNANTTISSGIPIDSTGTAKVSTKDTFNALWKNYYDEELAVLNDVSNKIKTVADSAKAAADDAKWAPMWQNNVFLSIPSGAKVGMRLSSPDVNMYTRLCRLSAGTYKSSRGTENIPTLLDAAQQLEYFNNSCLLVGDSYIVNWGDEFTVNVDTDVYVVFGTLRFFAQFKNSGSLTTTTTTANRVWSINDVTIYRTVSEAVEATQKAVSALDYLKAALTDGSTEIAGGLTMTNVLMLKNLEGFVTAGISGLTKHPNYPGVNENVLMWGGGTYEDAYFASNDDNYEKEDGTPITTLLKKDGTGKIGVFKISDTQVVVDVPNQGMVIIDASTSNGGIFIKDTDGIDKISILPKEISLSAVSVSTNYANNVIGTFTTSSIGTSGSYIVYVKNLLSLQAANGHSLCVRNIKVETKYPTVSNQQSGFSWSIETILTVGTDSISSIFYSNGIGSLSCSGNTSHTKIYPLTSALGVSVQYKVYSSKCSISAPMFTITCDECYELKSPPRTIIGSNGLVSSFDDRHMFAVINSADGQKIYAKGLSTAKGTAGSGELYVSQSFINAFKNLCDELNRFFPLVRTVGNNATNADECVAKVTAVKNMLDATSIIANS